MCIRISVQSGRAWMRPYLTPSCNWKLTLVLSVYGPWARQSEKGTEWPFARPLFKRFMMQIHKSQCFSAVIAAIFKSRAAPHASGVRPYYLCFCRINLPLYIKIKRYMLSKHRNNFYFILFFILAYSCYCHFSEYNIYRVLVWHMATYIDTSKQYKYVGNVARHDVGDRWTWKLDLWDRKSCEH